MLRWKGYYLDGRSASRVEVEVTVAPENLTITSGAGTLVWPYTEVRQTEGFYDNELIRIERGGEALCVADPGFLRAIREIAPRHSKKFHDPDRRKRRMIWVPAAAVAAVILTTALYFRGIPAAASYMAERIPVTWEEELGRQTLESFIGQLTECEDEVLGGHISKIVKRLDSAAPEHPYTFRVHVINTDAVNAFALPGGDIVIFSGLIEMTERPEELAGVLAHEMQHIILKHSTKGMMESLSTYMLFKFMAGDAYAGGLVQSLGNLRYSRLHEKTADEEGLEILLNAGVDPEGFIGFFEKMDELHGDVPEALSYLSTHPFAKERINYIRENTDGMRVETTALLPGVDWEEAKEGCMPEPTLYDTNTMEGCVDEEEPVED
jgi:Zn-dependent protease with chaperone function